MPKFISLAFCVWVGVFLALYTFLFQICQSFFRKFTWDTIISSFLAYGAKGLLTHLGRQSNMKVMQLSLFSTPIPSSLQGNDEEEVPAPAIWPQGHCCCHRLAAQDVTLPPSLSRSDLLQSLRHTPPCQRPGGMPELVGPQGLAPA